MPLTLVPASRRRATAEADFICGPTTICGSLVGLSVTAIPIGIIDLFPSPSTYSGDSVYLEPAVVAAPLIPFPSQVPCICSGGIHCSPYLLCGADLLGIEPAGLELYPATDEYPGRTINPL